MPASGAGPAEQVLAGLWLALLASAMWYRELYRDPYQPVPSKRCPKFFYVTAKRIDFWSRSVGS
jgi:hypothetical protein